MLRDSGMEESRHPKIAELRKFMLNRPSKAVLAPVAEGFGALAAALSKPFVPREGGYVQVDSGQKSRKVRNHMLRSPFKSVIARTAIFALVLSIGIAFVSAGMDPYASAQQTTTDPCSITGTEVTCTYDENSTDSVADFSALDPEGSGIDWSVEGLDSDDFSITGGVLSFKKSPNFESPTDRARTAEPTQAADNNVYLVTVRATEVRDPGATGAAESSTLDVTVTVNNVDEPGTAVIDLRQPQVDKALQVTISDPDGTISGQVYLWSVPKVSRAVLDDDSHWQPASATTTNELNYTPAAGDVGDYLRAKVSYTDAEGAEKTAYVKSEFATRAVPAANQAPDFDDNADYARSVPENYTGGAIVGAPVTATDPNQNDRNRLTYTIPTDGDAEPFAINKATGQITVKGKLDHEAGSTNDDGVYSVTVTATDPSGLTDTHAVTITATDVNEKPSVIVDPDNTTENSTPPENHPVKDDSTADPPVVSLVLGTYKATDQDAGDGGDTADASKVTLTLSGDDKDAFVLDKDDGQLRFKASPNFESPTDANKDNAYKVTVVATDTKGLTGEKALTITVTNVDEDGTVTLSTIQPGVGQVITATLTDEDGGMTGQKWQWSSSETETGTYDDISGATSASYTPKMTVKDDPATTDVNEAVAGDEGKYLRATVMYRDNASPKVDDPDTGNVNEATALNETFMATSKNAVRAVPSVNSAPAFAASTMTREVKENSIENTAVGDPVKASDADDDVLTYRLSGGADKGSFTIDAATGQIKVKKGTSLNYEGSQTTYAVEVTAADAFGGSDSTAVTISVANVNEAPKFEAKDPDAYDENGTGPVATFTATDPEGASCRLERRGA